MQPDERRRLMEDLAEHNDTHEPQGQPKVGLDFMSEFSTAVDSPKDAATFLGVDLQSPEISPESTLKLRIDQVQNIAFMVKKAEGILKGCVNANDYGTGKSVEALASVFFLAQRREACPDFGAYKAVLILCPHQAIRGWQETHAKFFSGLLSLHICSKSLSPGEHSQLIDPPSAPALAEFLDSLSPSDPQTGRTIILCTYGELSSKEFMVERKSEDAREKELSLRGSKLTEEALEALKVAQKPELYDLNFDPKIIGTLIVDEAHEIKHPKSRRAQMTYLLNAEIHFLLTANPVDNRISDFRGLLFALYRTIEVSMGDEKEEYDYLAERGFNFIFNPGGTSSAAGAARVINDNETPLAAFDNFWDTFLSHMTADLGLADVLRKSRSSESSVFLPDIDDLLQNNTDSGMSFYYRMTRRETDPVQPPADRASMIRHLVRQSPKLRWLLFKLEELKKKGEKVIVYCVHPLTQWLVEGVCSMAEFSFLSLRSKPKHGDETRATVIDEFNDPGKRHEFLLSTVGVLGYGVDLHADCHNMIIFELPDNIPTMLSAIGRIRRVGQTKPQEVSILTLKDSYDDYTLCRQSRKHATAVLAFGVLGARLDELAFRVDALVELDRRRQRKKKSSLLTRPDLRRLKRELPVLEVVKLLAAGELLRQHLGAQYNTSYDPWKCRRQRLFHFERMKLVDFAGANMDFNTETGRMILHRVAQFPASGPPCAGVGFLPSRFQD
ncbi:putative dead-like helicase [Diaporthe ampelina]|uniref:Putative dead-like helicase n=1 Tax=Diaporthe ampelina TaxID=1214573 RepID=A0A0G2HTC9_9PEZI|nr:putative dead-like helicase [Diaporthe ampelina]